jgi:hypothetical protein
VTLDEPTTVPSSEAINLDEGWDDLEDEPYTPQYPQRTLSEEFWDEFDAVFRAWKYVVTSWFTFPFKLSAIVTLELQRLWRYFLGLPMPGRSWGFHFPMRDEL